MSPFKVLFPFVFALAALGFGSAPPVQAAYQPLTNGSFQNDLDNWDVSDANFVTTAGGKVTLRESDADFSVILSQTFTFSTDALVLSFRIVGTTTDPISGSLPDGFNVSLLDPTNDQPLTAVALDGGDAYFTWDLVVEGAQPVPAGGVTLDGDLVKLDVSGLRGQDAKLQFRLIGGSEFNFNASITLADVSETNSGSGNPPDVNPVPAPPGLYLGASAAPFLLIFWRRGRKQEPHVAAQPVA